MRAWIADNQRQFEADILQRFCDGVDILNEQFARFRETQTLSFAVLAHIVGEPAQKGLLWRLKDKAHLTLRDRNNATPEGVLLDWAIGYIFHEVIKLVEDSRLRQYYMPRLAAFSDSGTHSQFSSMIADLYEIEGQTRESLEREIARIEKLVDLSIRLFCCFFFGKSSHRPLARLLYDKGTVIRRIFGSRYEAFIGDVYGNSPERLPLEAAFSLENSGRYQEALEALDACFALNSACGEAIMLKERISRGAASAFPNE